MAFGGALLILLAGMTAAILGRQATMQPAEAAAVVTNLSSNAGSDRVLDLIRPWLKPEHRMDMVSPSLSLYASPSTSPIECSSGGATCRTLESANPVRLEIRRGNSACSDSDDMIGGRCEQS